MERELIERTFRRDFRELLGLDIFEAANDLEILALKPGFGEIIPEAVATPLRLMSVNVLHVVDDFLHYDPERFPEPLDQYIHIYENKELILEMLAANMKVDSPFDDPVSYYLGFELNERFERFFANLLTVGKTHKFDFETIRGNLEGDPDEED